MEGWMMNGIVSMKGWIMNGISMNGGMNNEWIDE